MWVAVWAISSRRRTSAPRRYAWWVLYSRGIVPGALYSRESVPEQKAHIVVLQPGRARLHVVLDAAWVGLSRGRACEHANGRLAVGLLSVEQQRQRRRTRAWIGLGFGSRSGSGLG